MSNQRMWAVSLIASTLLGGAQVRVANAQPAQNYPGAALIENAARQMNSVTPPRLPQQVITVGTFDGATGRFTFALEESYPANVPASKQQANGGPVPPQHVADIGSYNVKYLFNVRNKPDGFAITVTFHGTGGDSTVAPATLDPSGTSASVTFHPQSFAIQTVRIRKPVRDTVVFITPRLHEQLGVFVVPYLLVGIVYEPPGAGSVANYSQTKTVNTVMSFDATHSAGIVQTINPNTFYDLANEAIGAGLDTFQKGAGKVWTSVASLADQPTVTKTTAITTGTTQSTGFGIAVSVGFNTALHQYPGNGDLFIILHDVMFGYLARDGKVTLAPLMYAGSPDYMSAAEMTQKLPATLAASFRAADPHFGKATIASSSSTTLGGVMLAGAAVRGQRARLVPFAPMTSMACKHIGSPFVSLTESDFTATTTSQTQSETDVTHNTGLMASILGGGDSSYATTYTTSREKTTGESQSTQITLLCATGDEFWVDLYLDDVFKTFYTLKGEPLAANPPIVGLAQSGDGRALANQQVRLRVGERTYIVSTDKDGNFAFPLQSSPRGAATIVIAGQSYALTLTGTSRNLLARGGVLTDRR